MTCKYCGEKLLDGQTVCLKCGKDVSTSNQINRNTSFFFTYNDSPNLNGHGKIGIILLCFFFGALGVHNFVMGEFKKGIVKLIASFICGLGYILSIIDFVKIILDKYTCNKESYF